MAIGLVSGLKTVGGVPILVEEAHKGICDDEEEEGGRGIPARDSRAEWECEARGRCVSGVSCASTRAEDVVDEALAEADGCEAVLEEFP